MESLGVDELHMSGARAIFRHSSRVHEDELAFAFEEQGMELESYRKERRPRPAAIYTIDSGVT